MAQVKKWEEVSREVVYKKYSQTIEKRDYRQPNGQVSDYYVRVEKKAACVLALTKDGKVITVSQFRPGPRVVLCELPGGMVDEGETPRDTAARELLEETGYAGDIEDWTGTWLSDAYTQSDRSIVIIKNCRKVAKVKLEDTEFGEVELLTIPEFVAQVRRGQLTDTAGAMLAMDHLGILSNAVSSDQLE